MAKVNSKNKKPKAPVAPAAPAAPAAASTDTATNDVSTDQPSAKEVIPTNKCLAIAKQAIIDNPDKVAEICDGAQPHEYETVLVAKLNYGTISPEDLA